MARQAPPALIEDDIERLIDIREVTDRLQVGGNTVRRWIEQGTFPPPLKLGTLARWRVATFNAWVAARIAEQGRRKRR